MKIHLILFFLFFTSSYSALSQNSNIPYNYSNFLHFESELNYNKNLIHSSFKPINNILTNYINIDSLNKISSRDSAILSNIKFKKLWKKIRTESLVIVDTGDFNISLDIILDLNIGKDLTKYQKLSTNSRGLLIKGNIGKRFYFQTLAVENQGFFTEYFSNYVLDKYVMPGMARVRRFKTSGFDYSYSSSYINYSPIDKFNFQFGHGKNFIGEGYRSLILSDFAPSYPFAKFSFQNKRIQYIYMMTSFQEVKNYDTKLIAYQRNHGTFSFLNFNIHKSLSIGLFEGTIWKTSGNKYNNKFNGHFFNPLIFYKAINLGLRDSNNVIVGLNFKIIPHKKIKLYGQYVIDDYSKYKNSNHNRQAYQIGLKIFNPIKGLSIIVEYNKALPYTYNHEVLRQNYTNMNNPLAHQLGANFSEKIGIISYNWKDFRFEYKANYIIQGLDTSDVNFGGNIFNQSNQFLVRPYFLDGNKTTIILNSISLIYNINPLNSLQLFITYSRRFFLNNSSSSTDEFIYFGIRTNLFNYYNDFL